MNAHSLLCNLQIIFGLIITKSVKLDADTSSAKSQESVTCQN